MNMAFLHIRDLHKSYRHVEVLKGIDIAIEEGEFLVLVGPSGCGKSTLLGTIAGLESVSSGEIYIGGQCVDHLHPSERDIAMVFQSYALYPNMTVAQNIAFGLEMRGVAKSERKAAVAKVAEMLQIGHLLTRRPAQLSGGQRQRVAMGRALVRDPQVFLFDEPLSNLDAKLRVDMRTEIKKLHQTLGTTIVYVTHDQVEAMTLATQLAVLKDGVLQQLGSPQEVYGKPANMFVAGFTGSPTMNLVSARIAPLASEESPVGQGAGEGDGALGARIGDRILPIPNPSPALVERKGEDVVLGLRPEHITDAASALPLEDASERGSVSGAVSLDCHIDMVEPTGADTFVFTRFGDTQLTARVRPSESMTAGQQFPLTFHMDQAHFFDPQTEMRI